MVNLSKFVPFLLLGVGSAFGATIPTGVSFSIDGIDETQFLGLPAVQTNTSFSLPLEGITISRVASVATFGWAFQDDPFITYFSGVQNLTSSVQTYSFTFSNPYVGGPYTILSDSFTDSFTDANGDGIVTIGLPAPFTSISQPTVDGVNRDGQGSPCSITGGGGFSGSCTPGPDLTNFSIPATNTAGTLGVTVNFTLSPGDIYTFNGRAELTSSAVPEPATYGSMAAGIGFLLVAAGRRRWNRSKSA